MNDNHALALANQEIYALRATVTRLRTALVEAAIPLEALNQAEREVPTPLSPDMNEGIAKALAVIRATLREDPNHE